MKGFEFEPKIFRVYELSHGVFSEFFLFTYGLMM